MTRTHTWATSRRDYTVVIGGGIRIAIDYEGEFVMKRFEGKVVLITGAILFAVTSGRRIDGRSRGDVGAGDCGILII